MLKLITPPVYGEVITNDDIEQHLRIDPIITTDPLLDAVGVNTGIYVGSAVEYVEGFTHRAVSTQTWDLVLAAFPNGAIVVPLPPLQSITSISYVDAAGDTQVIDPADYTVDTVNGLIAPVNYWPATKCQSNAVTIRFVAGYTTGNIPFAIRAAVLLLIGDLYENREGQQDIRLHKNDTVNRLLWPLRAW